MGHWNCFPLPPRETGKILSLRTTVRQVLRGIILANRRILLGVGRAGTRAKLGDKGSNPGGEELGRLVNRGVGRPTWLAGAL